jgi:gluconolactonase
VKAVETLVAEGFAFPEGPCVDADGILYVTELANRCVSKIVGGRRDVLATLGGSPNGAAFGPHGILYVCNGGGNWGPKPSTKGTTGPGGEPGLIQLVHRDGSFETLLSEIDGTALNSPNDICFDAHGGFYFTDPAWAKRTPEGVARAEDSPPGNVCYVTAHGDAVRAAGGMLFPNGLAVSPDGGSLIVAETGTGHMLQFPILAPGSLGEPEILAGLGVESGLDGMCFDADRRLVVAGCGSASLYVFSPGLTKVELTIELSDPDLTNCCFDLGMKSLYVTQANSGRIVSIAWPQPAA